MILEAEVEVGSEHDSPVLMGQESSKAERRLSQRKGTSSSVAPSKPNLATDINPTPSKPPSEETVSSTEANTHKKLSHSLSLFSTSPPVNSPEFSLMYGLLNNSTPNSTEDLTERSSSKSYGDTSRPQSTLEPLTPLSTEFPNQLSSPNVNSGSNPSISFNIHTSQKLDPSLSAQPQDFFKQTNSTGASLSRRSTGVISVVAGKKSYKQDWILAKLETLPRHPPSFTIDYSSSSCDGSVSQASVLGSSNFSFPSLWTKSPSLKSPQFQLEIPDELNDHLLSLSSSYQCHIRTSCRLLLRNQFKLASDIKDAETSCNHICTYTAPHLNHLKESHSQFADTLMELKEEVTNTRALLKSIFKNIERLNSHFCHEERLGYLKYQDQSHYPNLHQAYRKAMLKGSPPQFTNKAAGSGILNRRRRESATVLTLDSVLSDRHRPYSQGGLNIDDPLNPINYDPSNYNPDVSTRPVSSASRISYGTSYDDFGTSASQRLYDLTLSRPTTSISYRAYTPTHRTCSPSFRHSASAIASIPGVLINTPRQEDPGFARSYNPGFQRSSSPLSRISICGKNDLESLLLLPTDPGISPETSPESPSLENFIDLSGSNAASSAEFSLKGLLARVSSRISLNET